MTGYTSGKTTHDPEPWVEMEPGARHSQATVDAGNAEWRTWYGLRFDPRPEYDNHNPILEAMRQELNSALYSDAGEAAEDWLHSIERGDQDGSISDDKITHAYRVLTKLAALTTNGVTD